MPLARFIAYEHCLYESLGINCYPPGDTRSLDKFEAMKAAWQPGAEDPELDIPDFL